MNYTTIGSPVPINKRLLVVLSLWIFLLSSCVPKETFTETYFISNGTDQEVSLVTNHSVVWDYGQNAGSSRVWYNSNTLTVAPHATIRLHPIIREDRSPQASYQWSVRNIIGTSTALIASTDTICWDTESKDSADWNIYKAADWETVEVESHTYNHTFNITQEKIERSLQ